MISLRVLFFLAALSVSVQARPVEPPFNPLNNFLHVDFIFRGTHNSINREPRSYTDPRAPVPAHVPYIGNTFTVKGKTLSIGEVIGVGEHSIVYDVPEGWKGQPVVLKLNTKVKAEDRGRDNELNILQQLGDLIAHSDNWILQKRKNGEYITETKLGKDAMEAAKTDPKACIKLMQDAIDLRWEAIVKAAQGDPPILHLDANPKYAVYEQDNNGQLIKAHLVGWGQATFLVGHASDDFVDYMRAEHLPHIIAEYNKLCKSWAQ